MDVLLVKAEIREPHLIAEIFLLEESVVPALNYKPGKKAVPSHDLPKDIHAAKEEAAFGDLMCCMATCKLETHNVACITEKESNC